MVEKIEKGIESPEDAVKRGYVRSIVETTVVISEVLEIDLVKIRDGITAEIDSREKKKIEEEERKEWYKSLPYGMPMGF